VSAKNAQEAQAQALAAGQALTAQFTAQFPGAKVNVSNTGLKSQYGNYTSAAAVPKSQLQKQAQQMAAAQGWTGAEWNALSDLVQRESGWNPNAQNPHSTANGLGQFLDSTWKSTGYQKSSDPTIQLKALFRYVQQRYGSPTKALQFWLSRKPINGRDVGNWY
jgi:hypothetical protein